MKPDKNQGRLLKMQKEAPALPQSAGLPHNLSSVFEAVSTLKNDIVHNGPPTCIVNLDGQIIYANPAYEDIAWELQDTDLIENALHPPYSAEEIEAIKLAGGPNPNEYSLKIGDRVRHFLATYHHFDGGNQKLHATAIVLRPNDELIQLRSTVASISERLNDMARLVSDWTWETNRELGFTYVSPQVQKVLGYHPSELLGGSLASLSGGEDNVLAVIREAIDNRKPFRDQEITFKNRSGDERFFLLSGIPFYSKPCGEFSGYRGSARDITDQYRQQRILHKAKESAEFANRAKSEFLANMSHELRTPLNAIIGFSEMMASQLLGPLGNEQYNEYSHDIHESAKHLLSVINDILDVAKIEAGKLELLEDGIDPLKLAVSVQRLMVERAENAGLTLNLQLPSKLPMLYADQRKLKQILINLLANAVKFTPEGGAIQLSAKVNEAGDFEFTIADTGIGIAEEDIPKAFEPFSQIDSTLSRQFEGTGLGLPLAQGLARLHGGDLFMESAPGEGTTVICRLPASRILDD